MQPVFESVTTVTQTEFPRWVRDQERSGRSEHFELLNGRIVMTPPAGYPHGSVTLNLASRLREHVKSRDLGHVFESSQGYELPSSDTVGPDVSFISTETWARGPAPVEGQYLAMVPDLAAEVLSTSTASRDRGEKKAIYERNGVKEYWLVDTRAREVMVFSLHDGRFDSGVVFGPTDLARSSLLADFSIAVEDLFSP